MKVVFLWLQSKTNTRKTKEAVVKRNKRTPIQRRMTVTSKPRKPANLNMLKMHSKILMRIQQDLTDHDLQSEDPGLDQARGLGPVRARDQDHVHRLLVAEVEPRVVPMPAVESLLVEVVPIKIVGDDVLRIYLYIINMRGVLLFQEITTFVIGILVTIKRFGETFCGDPLIGLVFRHTHTDLIINDLGIFLLSFNYDGYL